MGKKKLSLKEKNISTLHKVTALNLALLWITVSFGESRFSEFSISLKIISGAFPSTGLGLLSLIMEYLIPSNGKEWLVYFKYHKPLKQFVLPGGEAFSFFMLRERSRISPKKLSVILKLKKFPRNCRKQNQCWYQLHLKQREDEALKSQHEKVLLLRDYTALSALWLILGISSSLILIKTYLIFYEYAVFLLIQFICVKIAASNCGKRYVVNVLARGSHLNN